MASVAGSHVLRNVRSSTWEEMTAMPGVQRLVWDFLLHT